MILAVTLGEDKDEACYRVISPAYAGAPLSGMGAARQGGRFNRPGQEALYLSLDETTAWRNTSRTTPGCGRARSALFSSADCGSLTSAPFDPANWPPLWADFSVDWRTEWFGKSVEPPSWYMADDVVSEGLDGILFPSQARPSGLNLVVYRSSSRPLDQLRVYDPDGALRKIAPR
jgi:Uncharacterized conserved protein